MQRVRVVLAATRSWPVRPVTSPEERGASSLTLTLRPIHARLGAVCGGDRPQSVHPSFSAVQQKLAVKPAAQLTACVVCTACIAWIACIPVAYGAHSSAPALSAQQAPSTAEGTVPDRLSREFHPLLFCGPSVPAAACRRSETIRTALDGSQLSAVALTC